jgi:hypothetical protein
MEKSMNTADTKIRLMETTEWPNQRPPNNVRYVRLSHCWGQGVTSQHKLTSSNIEAMKTGIQLNSLPKSFQDAITFAARLPQVGYIWIDSLCIKQGLEDQSDWLKQSATMYKVYSETFLNISATHAADSQGGLFRPRPPELLLEDEITLNIEGLPGAHPPRPKHLSPENAVQAAEPLGPSTGRKFLHVLATYWLVHKVFMFLRLLHNGLNTSLELDTVPSFDSQTTGSIRKCNEVDDPRRVDIVAGITGTRRSGSMLAVINTLKRSGTGSGLHILGKSGTGTNEDSDTAPAEHHNLKRCTILDASFWFNRVDNAPVNKRGWVLQERLMAPRVLHFCHDQIAWECCGFDAAEGQPEGMPNFQLTSGEPAFEEFACTTMKNLTHTCGQKSMLWNFGAVSLRFTQRRPSQMMMTS